MRRLEEKIRKLSKVVGHLEKLLIRIISLVGWLMILREVIK